MVTGMLPVIAERMSLMKKTAKKLALNRETLTNLEENLGQVAGGITLRCPYSGQNTCNTCVATCTSNYC